LANLIFGTSGWSYKEWVGPFYQDAKKMFSYYARFFSTAEINSTFYRYPMKTTIYGLDRTSAKDFVFSAKLPRLITHEKRLDPDLDTRSDLVRFLELMEPLNARGKLGCILIQLPPSFRYDQDVDKLKAFLELLPDGYEFAAEFRDYSWIRPETWSLLRKHNVAYCIVDEPLLPSEVQVTADFAYFRWHGRGTRPWYDYCYSKAELEEWVPRVEQTRDKVDKVYGYFNNHFHGYAVENCIEILEMLNAASSELTKVKENIVRHNARRPAVRERKLEDFGFGVRLSVIEDFILKLTDIRRYERGRDISDMDLFIEESSDRMVKARIRDYVIELNLENRVLKHDCDDWRKGLGMKRVCKHLVKFFLAMQLDRAEEILRDINRNKSSWVFQLLDSSD